MGLWCCDVTWQEQLTLYCLTVCLHAAAVRSICFGWWMKGKTVGLASRNPFCLYPVKKRAKHTNIYRRTANNWKVISWSGRSPAEKQYVGGELWYWAVSHLFTFISELNVQKMVTLNQIKMICSTPQKLLWYWSFQPAKISIFFLL